MFLLLRDRSCVCLGPGLLRHVLNEGFVDFVLCIVVRGMLELTFFEDTDAAASTGCMSLVVDISHSLCPWLWTEFREPGANVSLVVD